jgi:hypothetical protein
MLIRKRFFGALLLSCGLAVPALLAVALPASASVTHASASVIHQQAASCGWETIYSASDPQGGTVELQYDTCDRYVRAYAYGLPDNFGCHINLGCHGWESNVWVYNENTGQSSGGVIDQTSYTTGAINDAGTQSHACLEDGYYNGSSWSWYGKNCTGYF